MSRDVHQLCATGGVEKCLACRILAGQRLTPGPVLGYPRDFLVGPPETRAGYGNHRPGIVAEPCVSFQPCRS